MGLTRDSVHCITLVNSRINLNRSSVPNISARMITTLTLFRVSSNSPKSNCSIRYCVTSSTVHTGTRSSLLKNAAFKSFAATAITGWSSSSSSSIANKGSTTVCTALYTVCDKRPRSSTTVVCSTTRLCPTSIVASSNSCADA